MKKEAQDNSYLFENEVKEIEEAVARAPDLDLTAFKVFPPKQLANPDSLISKYTVADTDTGAAELIRLLGEYPRMNISGNEVENTMRKIGVQFEMPTADVALSRQWQKPLNTEFAERAKRMVDEKTNEYLYRGDAIFGAPGFLELSGVSTFSGSSFDTASLNLSDQITRAVNAIPQQFRGRAYKLVLADQEWKALRVIGNTTTNQDWMTLALSANPNLTIELEAELLAGGTLGGGGTISDGEAWLVPQDKTLCRAPIGSLGRVLQKPADLATFEELAGGKVNSTIGAVEVPFPTAVVKITGWK